MVSYHYSNESLDAIVKGMKPDKEDDIIAICGAGDQAFALLEHANSVIAVDCNAKQAAYAKARAEALKAGDYVGFFPNIELSNWIYEKHKKNSREYFSRRTLIERILGRKPRLEMIRSKLDNLEFREGSLQDFVKEMQSRKYSKAYLSNAMTYGRLAKGSQRGFIERLAAKLRNPGIIYLADGGSVCLEHIYNLEQDEKLTKVAVRTANGRQSWRPAVYRRKA